MKLENLEELEGLLKEINKVTEKVIEYAKERKEISGEELDSGYEPRTFTPSQLAKEMNNHLNDYLDIKCVDPIKGMEYFREYSHLLSYIVAGLFEGAKKDGE